ncbi:hypothetical protein BDV25DRAFT_135151 [Aspergillus avenaceus]|uniref:NAD-dependent epimerase/dehydratase domain-containing protein n=1 Tax=Aspergillus avenaceus TaxID=36643 RepID=A0A5N6U924_ASPAV|nr:hypothetical protein BDV25DRAFT_135151 [Aspergillus avenaceus]
MPLRIPRYLLTTISRPQLITLSDPLRRHFSITPNQDMKIAITGARGTVGRAVVKAAADAGHATVQVDRTDTEYDGTPNSEMKTADTANDFDATLNAFRGCDAVIHLAAIPSPIDKGDDLVHNNNVNSSFNGFRAAAELGIRRFCYASSVNAIGLEYATRPLNFDYFPVDEEAPQRPTDSYALAKDEAESQARAFARWYPGMNIACMRIHAVAPRSEAQKGQLENWDSAAVKSLWGWVSAQATARACLLAVEKAEKLNGTEVFNVVAPTTTQDIPSRELAQKYYPDAEIRGELSGNQSFFTTEKAKRILGWVHEEKE